MKMADIGNAEFDRFDLRSFRMKFCTSAPFHADLKADILKRWLDTQGLTRRR